MISLASTLPNSNTGYVAAAYIVFLAVILIYVTIMAVRLTRNQRELAELKAELDRLGIVSKRREAAGGRLAGGQHFSRGALYLMLQNRIYRGDIVHQGAAYPGQQAAILDPELWQIVQGKLAANRQERALGVNAEAPSLLAGLIWPEKSPLRSWRSRSIRLT